jgi:hypothetical protein
MKKFLLFTQNILITLTFSSNLNAQTETECYEKKTLSNSIIYQDKKNNLTVYLGSLFRLDSQLVFEPYDNKYENDLIPVFNTNNLDIEKEIKKYQKQEKIKDKIRKNLTKILIQEFDKINKYKSIPPKFTNSYINIETKSLDYFKHKIILNHICNQDFIEYIAKEIYLKHNILIIPKVD